MLTLTVDVFGDEQVVRGLSRFADACSDYTPVWPEIRDSFVEIEREQFDSQGSRSGQTWAALKPSYQAWKEKHFPGRPILELTGDMKFAMTEGVQANMEPLRLELGPIPTRATWHQHGTSRMVDRPPVVLTEEDKREWVRTIQRYLVDKATEEGLR